MKTMAERRAAQNLEVRKEMLRLKIRQQELEIENDFRKLGESLTVPAIQNSFFEYLAKNPESAFRAGLLAVNIFTRIFRGKKTKTSKNS
jgi:hypothetical protein